MIQELTDEEQVKEVLKLARGNPVECFLYFIDNYVFIEDKENKRAIRFRMWPEQRRVAKLIVENPLLIILKARQLGLTWLVAAFILFQMIRNPLWLGIIFSTTEDLAIEFLERIYFIADRCPVWMGTTGVPVKTHTKQVFELMFPAPLNTVSCVKSLPTTMMGGQSKTPNLLVMDETCKNPLAKNIYNASLPGIEAAKGQAIIISNAIKEGAGWLFTRDTYIASMRGMNRFRRVFLPWSAHPGRPEDFKQKMLMAGMEQREVDENYPDTEEEAITDRNIRGVYYAMQMATAKKEGRICSVPYVEGHEVYTFWDLGVDDSTSIWFLQQIGREFRFIDYYENSGMGMVHYAKILKDKDYVYGDHYMPHDVEKRELGGDTETALSVRETAENLGIKPILTVKKAKDSQAILNGIEAGRNILGQCWFDEKKCVKGITCLESYRAEWDEDNQKLDNKPVRNFAIHGADAFRTFSAGFQIKNNIKSEKVYSRSYTDQYAFLSA